jgi:hypothetical protein
VLLGFGLVAGSLVSPAAAARKPKPVATTLYMHGTLHVADLTEWLSGAAGGTHRMMDATEPAAGAPKSQSFSFAAGNLECAGNELFPSWEGKIAGKLASDVTIKANFVSAPTTVTARVWIDVPFGSCTSSNTGSTDFQPPVAEVTVDVPPGSNEVEIVLEGLKGKKAKFSMIVQLHQTSPAGQGRILYDSADFASRVEFSCIPASGKSCAI